MMIGKRIREVRLQNDMSLRDFAELIGVADTTVMKWEKNNSGVPFEMAIQICQKFGCTLNWLAGVKEESQEKQVPKKPKNMKTIFDFSGRYYSTKGECPACGAGVSSSSSVYCDKCGQKIDWD
ncbi:MAG: helix-turn-helix transcriptional regulator [Eubacteriales bacterium]|nr:helix-turn-helix transcriptional regulator [Eubacteriales bacterium]